MFRFFSILPSGVVRFPRVRGDVPHILRLKQRRLEFSPRARGCSAPRPCRYRHFRVFPACAGMFPVSPLPGCISTGFPRVRGDVPILKPAPNPSPWFSPRARGCSACIRFIASKYRVFPACAGMFPLGPIFLATINCFPRVRGDVPHLDRIDQTHCAFSPRARGCS